LGKYRIWLRYEDGAQGEVDLGRLAGEGVFRAWEQPGVFDRVYIAPYGAVAWSDTLDICPDSLYLDLTGKRPEEVFPGLKSVSDA
jgi:hypothetical protein